MSSWFHQLLVLPVLSEDDQASHRRSLQLIFLTIVGGAGLYALFIVVFSPAHLSRIWIPGAVLGVTLVTAPVLRRGRIPFAGAIIALALYIIFSIAALTAGGVRSPGFYGYLLSITIMGLLVSSRAAIGMAAVGSISGLVLTVVENTGHLPAPAMIHTPETTWVVGSVYFFVLALSLFAIMNTLNLASRRIARNELELHDSERYNQAILDAIPDMIFRINREGVYLDFRSARGLTPIYPPENFIGKHQNEVLPPAVATESQENIELALTTQSPQRFEYSLTLEGATNFFVAYLVPITPNEVLGFVRDVTARKQVEQALRESERKYRQLVEMAQEGIWVIDKDAKTQYVNPSMARMLGYSPSEMLGRHLFDFMDDEGQAVSEINFERWIEGIEEQHDFEFMHKDGTRIFTIMETAPLSDEHGNYAGALSGVVDVTRQRLANDKIRQLNADLEQRVALRTSELEATILQREKEIEERRRTERALRLGEERYRAIVEDQTEFICRFRPDGTITFVNAAYCRYFGHSREELLGSHYLPLILEEDRHLLAQNLSLLDCDQQVETVEIRMISENGQLLWNRWNHRTICDERGIVTEYQAVGADITRQRNAEDAIRLLNEDLRDRANCLEVANRELRSFSYSVSHDLRAPLRAISGFSNILARRYRDRLDDDGRRYIDNVVEASEHMDCLIEDLLTYARMGRQAVHREQLSLNTLFNQVKKTYSKSMEEDGGIVSVPVEDLLVQGDPTLLHQVFLNVIDNAFRYHRRGIPPEVGIVYESFEDEHIIHISDNGIGIESAHLSKIFDMFQRLHSEESYPGNGIGLALVKKALAMMGGDVSVDSTPGEGSTFTLRLPRN